MISTGRDALRGDNRSSSTPEQLCTPPAEELAECIQAALARALLDLRTKRGWSVYDLEQRSGVSRSTLSRIERAVTSPTVTVLARVCWAYGHSVASLVAEAEGTDPSDPRDTDSAQL
ncbi:helix-turn-helix domain-containing protein [Streptomyces sp. NPDC004250]|uniref:helix-turn-helix domain-containing protein n=1 Tax=Streptomyces sp. NPDC004250 TaxID=3364692 RepID=UPI0036800320